MCCGLNMIFQTRQGPPPAIPYIFKFQDGCLHMCGPADHRMHRATSFDGPGLCIMEKVETYMPSVPNGRNQAPTQLPLGQRLLC